ncbi:MAG: hypothetical protein PVH61_41875 [Candidatus Aminicenantes bacterium]|jgi:hypothetical protein
MGKKNQTNAMRKMAEAKRTISPVDSQNEREAILKRSNRKAGAFFQAEKNIIFNLADQIQILVEDKENGSWKKLGYTNFYDYCERELDISTTKAKELIRFNRNLGKEFLVAATKCGIKRKHLLALSNHSDDIQIETDTSHPKVIYLDEEIIINHDDPDSVKKLQNLGKKLGEQDKEIIDLKSDVGQLKREITDLNEYQKKINDIKVQVISYGSQFKKLREYAKDDPDKYDALVREIHSLQNWLAELSDELLDKAQEDPDEFPDEFPDDQKGLDN